jgi:glycine/D-amino acid oxidase-like deaminating enzyme
MTATLFNLPITRQPQPPLSVGLLRPAVRSIVIVGGGTAGWMTAMILANALIDRGVSISLLESPTVETIGVGEGSTPWLRGFFDGLDIEESEWMPACHATYKCGIRFDGWSTRPGFETYFHPFASMLDNLTMTQFVHNTTARVNGADVDAHPNRFFIASRLADLSLAPIPADNFPFDVWYGYHFDAVLLGKYLHRKAVERGVTYRVCHVTHANLDEQGAIASVATREGDTIEADFFVDCTGFASLLIGKALETPFVSFADNLFNDSAVAMPTPIAGSSGVTDRRDSVEARLGLEDSADESLRQRLRLQLGLLFGVGRRARAARISWTARLRCDRASPQDANRACHQALEPELPRGRTVAGLHRAARGHRAALHPEKRAGHRRIPAKRRFQRRGARPLQPACQRALRGNARLHRDALQDELEDRYRVLACETLPIETCRNRSSGC